MGEMSSATRQGQAFNILFREDKKQGGGRQGLIQQLGMKLQTFSFCNGG